MLDPIVLAVAACTALSGVVVWAFLDVRTEVRGLTKSMGELRVSLAADFVTQTDYDAHELERREHRHKVADDFARFNGRVLRLEMGAEHRRDRPA